MPDILVRIVFVWAILVYLTGMLALIWGMRRDKLWDDWGDVKLCVSAWSYYRDHDTDNTTNVPFAGRDET